MTKEAGSICSVCHRPLRDGLVKCGACNSLIHSTCRETAKHCPLCLSGKPPLESGTSVRGGRVLTLILGGAILALGVSRLTEPPKEIAPRPAPSVVRPAPAAQVLKRVETTPEPEMAKLPSIYPEGHHRARKSIEDSYPNLKPAKQTSDYPPPDGGKPRFPSIYSYGKGETLIASAAGPWSSAGLSKFVDDYILSGYLVDGMNQGISFKHRNVTDPAEGPCVELVGLYAVYDCTSPRVGYARVSYRFQHTRRTNEVRCMVTRTEL